MKKIKNIFYAFLVSSLFTNIFACTGILLKTTNNSCIYARTLEFGLDLKSKILFVPKNYNLVAISPDQKPQGLKWTSKYPVLGINAFDSENFVDGVNSAGLAGGLFYFPDFAQYQDVTVENYSKSIPMWSLLTWILTSFKTTEEVKKELKKIYVSKTEFPGMGENPPAHLIVHDSYGKSIVIEYINGKLNIHDNPLGVITNSPGFDWHMTNLRNYINLSPINSKSKVLGGVTISQLGQGSGMLGLPGDFTPPSRFVRAVYFSQSAPKLKTELDAVYHAFRILNNFDIPLGSVIDKSGTSTTSEFTLWTSAIDMRNKIVYYRPHANFQLQKAELNKLNLSSKKSVTISMDMQDNIIDSSDRIRA